MKSQACVLLAALAAVGVGRAAEKPPTAAHAELESALRKNIDGRIDAFLRGDSKDYRRFLLAGAVFVTARGIDSDVELLASLKPSVGERLGFEMASGMRVEDYGTTAVAMYMQRQTHDYGGQHFDVERGIVDTFVKQGDRWLLATHAELRALTKHPPLTVDPAVYGSYVGEYTWGTCCVDKVTLENGKLMGLLTGEDRPDEFKPVSDAAFYIDEDNDDGLTTFVKDAHGKVTGYVYEANGHRIVATKVH